MKFKHTLGLLVVLGALAAYIYFVDSKTPTTKEREEKKGRIFAFDRDKISEINIKTPETKIDLKKDGQNWKVEAPVKDRADSGTMSALLTSIELLRSESTIDNDGKGVTKDQLKDYGLAEAQSKITMVVEGKPVHFLLGKDTAIENRIYAMVEGGKAVEVISNSLKNDISKKADDFRDRKLSDLSLGQIKKAVIKSAAGEIEVEKSSDHWALVRPMKARGDDSKIGDTISQALTARVESFVPDATKLGEYGLEQPRGTVTLVVEGQAQPQVLSIGGHGKDEKEKDKVYAKLSSRDSIVLLPNTIENILGLKPNDLRDKKLVQFNSDMVDRITVEPFNKEKLVFARNGAKAWVRKAADKDVDVNTNQINKLLEDLGSASVVNFVEDVATDLPKYGLDKPSVKVTLSAFSSENTAETKAGEKPIVALLFGRAQDNEVFMKLDDEPFIVSTQRTILSSISTDPLQLQPLEIYKNKSEDITSFEVARDGQPTLTLERDKDKNWKLAKGDDKVNPINVQNIVNSIASLRAVSWVGATTPAHGLEKPVVTITFRTSGNTSGKLKIGGADPQDMYYASADGLNGTFLIPKTDYDVFVSSVLEKPLTAAPAATPPPAAPAKPDASPAPAPAPAPAAPVVPATPTPAPAPAPVPAPAPAGADKPKSTEAPAPAPAQPPAKADGE